MGYKIEYQPASTPNATDSQPKRILLFTGMFVLLFGVMVWNYWPDGRQFLQYLLIPGDAEVTIAAVRTLVQSLASGVPASDALQTFCICILEGSAIAVY